jgi:predicted AlkP superfamily pyrophosphatase or phosphodiesterase
MVSTLVAMTASAMAGCSSQEGLDKTPTRLAVVIVVDQMCQHHVTRFGDLFTGGLKRILDGGTVFTSAWHDHAKTHTSPGHATIATGTYPSHHGIVANSWYDRTNDFATTYSALDESVHAVGRPDQVGVSPRQMRRDALGDWLKKKSPGSKVYSVSLKDYASVLVAGKRPDGAFWYDTENGTYCTSTYYMDSYPAWAQAFNDTKPSDDYLEAVWTRSMPAGAYERSRDDRFAAELDGHHTTFPYRVKETAETQEENFYEFLRSTPFADELSIRFASALVTGERLGEDDAPDLLFLGCSAADFIGHGWGPYSQEVEDYYLKLDRYLETFFELLDRRVGPGNYTVVLTSDHGVDPIPEDLADEFAGAERIDVDRYYADLDEAESTVKWEFGIEDTLIHHRSRGLTIDPAVVRGAGASAPEIRGRLAEVIEQIPYVEVVYTYDELSGGGEEDDGKYLRLARNSFYPGRSPDLYVVFKEHRLLTGSSHGTTHGSPHDYDRHVPLVFWGPGIASGTVDERVATVDVAPTLCEFLGIGVPAGLDGRPLTSWFEQPETAAR